MQHVYHQIAVCRERAPVARVSARGAQVATPRISDAKTSDPDCTPAIRDLARTGSDAVAIRRVEGGSSIARAEDEDLRADHEADAAARGLVVLDRGRRHRARGHPGSFAAGGGGKIGA